MSFIFIISVLWSARICINILSFVHLWYVKEYRLDRLFIHLQTEQGKRLYFLPFRKPPLTPKTITLVAGSVVLLTIIFLSLPYGTLIRFVTVDILSFPVTLFLVLLMRIPTIIYHEIRIRQAVSMLRSHSPMVVIGITGSYGKTSTKEYLATILSSKYKVLKTEASKNSPIGIAETILTSLRPNYEVFIVEMGAYKKGEIARMTDMVSPQIGIITAINAQHQDLFGTIDNTMRAKYELIQRLTGKKIAIFNTNNSYVKRMASWARESRLPGDPPKRRVWSPWNIAHVASSMKGISFDLTYQRQRAHISIPILGEHQCINVTLAVMGAVAAGMSFGEAAKAAENIRPFEKTMQPVPGVNGSLFINDTFNNNPDAAIAALSFLQKTTGKKILVFQPMIELGSYAARSHADVAKFADKVCNEIILTNNNFYEDFMRGIHNKNKIHMYNPREGATFIKNYVRRADTVLFKGKEAEQVMNLLI